MPYKNPEDKKRYNMLHNPNRVNSRQRGKRVWLRQNRNYVCILCGSVGRTEFHEYNGSPENVLELCSDCHDAAHGISINTIEDILSNAERQNN